MDGRFQPPSSSSRSIVKALWAFGPLRFVTLRQPSQECKEAKCILEDPLFRCPRLFQCLPFASRERRELFYIVLFLWGTLLPVFIEPFLRILASSVLDLPVSQAISKRSRHLCEAISLSRYPFGKLESVGWSALALRAAAARQPWARTLAPFTWDQKAVVSAFLAQHSSQRGIKSTRDLEFGEVVASGYTSSRPKMLCVSSFSPQVFSSCCLYFCKARLLPVAE